MRFVLSQQSRTDLAAQFEQGGLFDITLTNSPGKFPSSLQIELWISSPVFFSRTCTVRLYNTHCSKHLSPSELNMEGRSVTNELATLIEVAAGFYGLDEIIDDERLPAVLRRVINSGCNCIHHLTTEDDLTLGILFNHGRGYRASDCTFSIGSTVLNVKLPADRDSALAALSSSLQAFLQAYRQQHAA